jgi:Tfp pilus assembly protein PilN
MRKVRIDFAPPGLRRTLHRMPPNAWALVPAVLALVVNVVSGALKYRDEREAIARLQAQARVQTAQAQAQKQQAAPVRAVPEAQANAVNAAVLQLNLPWRGLHDAIQAATPAGIALLALEPDAKKSSVRITAEARSSDDMIGYVARLQDVDWFNAVLLTRHEINEQDPNRPIRFQIDAQWRAAP